MGACTSNTTRKGETGTCSAWDPTSALPAGAGIILSEESLWMKSRDILHQHVTEFPPILATIAPEARVFCGLRPWRLTVSCQCWSTSRWEKKGLEIASWFSSGAAIHKMLIQYRRDDLAEQKEEQGLQGASCEGVSIPDPLKTTYSAMAADLCIIDHRCHESNEVYQLVPRDL